MKDTCCGERTRARVCVCVGGVNAREGSTEQQESSDEPALAWKAISIVVDALVPGRHSSVRAGRHRCYRDKKLRLLGKKGTVTGTRNSAL